jgi:hypothetical protein
VIAVLDHGIGNLRSAEKALQHLGVDAALTTDPAVARRARGVVVPGNEDDRRVGQCLAQPLELAEGEDDGGVGGPDGVEEIPGDDDGIRPRGDHAVDRGPEGVPDVGFALVDAKWRLTVVLPDAQVGIGDVGEFHGWIQVRLRAWCASSRSRTARSSASGETGFWMKAASTPSRPRRTMSASV